VRELPDFTVHMPETLDQVLELLETGEKTVFAGGTDLIPMMKRGKIRPRDVIDLSGVGGLRYIRRSDGFFMIGSRTTVKDLVDTQLLDHRYAAIKSLGRYFGVEPTRTMATVGGNLASGGERDLPQIFEVLNAKVKLLSAGGERIVGPLECRPASGELIVEITVPELGPRTQTWFSKFEKRAANGIGVVTTAVFLKLSIDGSVEDVRIMLNRVMGRKPGRLYLVEQSLKGRMIDADTLNNVATILEDEINPASDFRASSEFRKHISKVLVGRALLECVKRIRG
jgi:aerobic carbon-monoxide dehydrogenase medium subunit